MEEDGSEWEDVDENEAGNEVVIEKVMVSTASQTGDHMSLRSAAKEGTLHHAWVAIAKPRNVSGHP